MAYGQILGQTLQSPISNNYVLGQIVYGANPDPKKFVPCNGQPYTEEQYPGLNAVIGNQIDWSTFIIQSKQLSSDSDKNRQYIILMNKIGNYYVYKFPLIKGVYIGWTDKLVNFGDYHDLNEIQLASQNYGAYTKALINPQTGHLFVFFSTNSSTLSYRVYNENMSQIGSGTLNNISLTSNNDQVVFTNNYLYVNNNLNNNGIRYFAINDDTISSTSTGNIALFSLCFVFYNGYENNINYLTFNNTSQNIQLYKLIENENGQVTNHLIKTFSFGRFYDSTWPNNVFANNSYICFPPERNNNISSVPSLIYDIENQQIITQFPYNNDDYWDTTNTSLENDYNLLPFFPRISCENDYFSNIQYYLLGNDYRTSADLEHFWGRIIKNVNDLFIYNQDYFMVYAEAARSVLQYLVEGEDFILSYYCPNTTQPCYSISAQKNMCLPRKSNAYIKVLN